MRSLEDGYKARAAAPSRAAASRRRARALGRLEVGERVPRGAAGDGRELEALVGRRGGVKVLRGDRAGAAVQADIVVPAIFISVVVGE